jgi:hypothetical protein
MWQRDSITAYREMRSADRSTFRKWLVAHVIGGAISVIAVIAIASAITVINKRGSSNEVASQKQLIQQAAAH